MSIETMTPLSRALGNDATRKVVCGIIDAMEASKLPVQDIPQNAKPSGSGHLVGVQGRLARPFWGVMGIWAALCGAVASGQLLWARDSLVTLALTIVLVELAWGSVWDLMVGTNWYGPLGEGWLSSRPRSLTPLPYTQPNAPAGRVFRGVGRLSAWWSETFWPSVGPALLGIAVSGGLLVLSSLLLSPRIAPLNAILMALVGLGLIAARHGRRLLAGDALVLVGLSWLAGHLALGELTLPSLVLSVACTVSCWGGLHLAAGLRAGRWLWNSGQLVVAVVLIVIHQPLAAGAVGILLVGQIALQQALVNGSDGQRVFRQLWPWLMIVMLLAVAALP